MRIAEGILIFILVKLLEIEYAVGASDEERIHKRKTDRADSNPFGFLKLGPPSPSDLNRAALEGPVRPQKRRAKQESNPNAAHAGVTTGCRTPRWSGGNPDTIIEHNFFPGNPSTPSVAPSSSVRYVKSDPYIQDHSDLVIGLTNNNCAVGSVRPRRSFRSPPPSWLSGDVLHGSYEVYILAPDEASWRESLLYFKHQLPKDTIDCYPVPQWAFLILPNGSQRCASLVEIRELKGGIPFSPYDRHRYHIFVKNTDGKVYKGKFRDRGPETPTANYAQMYRDKIKDLIH